MGHCSWAQGDSVTPPITNRDMIGTESLVSGEQKAAVAGLYGRHGDGVVEGSRGNQARGEPTGANKQQADALSTT